MSERVIEIEKTASGDLLISSPFTPTEKGRSREFSVIEQVQIGGRTRVSSSTQTSLGLVQSEKETWSVPASSLICFRGHFVEVTSLLQLQVWTDQGLSSKSHRSLENFAEPTFSLPRATGWAEWVRPAGRTSASQILKNLKGSEILTLAAIALGIVAGLGFDLWWVINQNYDGDIYEIILAANTVSFSFLVFWAAKILKSPVALLFKQDFELVRTTPVRLADFCQISSQIDVKNVRLRVVGLQNESADDPNPDAGWVTVSTSGMLLFEKTLDLTKGQPADLEDVVDFEPLFSQMHPPFTCGSVKVEVVWQVQLLIEGQMNHLATSSPVNF